MNIRAKLLPLRGKYYGTEIEICDGPRTFSIKLWNDGSYEPSDRELESIGCTIEQWRNNEKLPVTHPDDTKYWPDGIPAKEALEICDSHFESRETHRLAVYLVSLINA